MSKRRAKGEGSIYKRRDGTWCGALTLPGGKRRYVYGKTQAEVVQKLNALKNAPAGANLNTQTVGQFLTAWLDTKRLHIRENTYKSYEQQVRIRILPHIGRMKLQAITARDIEHVLVSCMHAGASLGTTRLVLRVLRLALAHAVRYELLSRNVASLVAPPPPPAPIAKALTPAQVRVLLDAACGNRYYIAILLAVRTGMRAGELLVLRWDDIDFGAGTLSIKQGKTRASVRTLHLPVDIVHALSEHYAANPDAAFVLHAPIADRVSHSRLREQFARVLKQANLPHFRFHDLRHTAATLAAQAGVHPSAVQAMLGHSNIATTMNIYTHVGNEDVAHALEEIGKNVAKLHDTL